MALAKQVTSIALRQGVDRKSDRKSVAAGKLLLLENGVFDTPGSIRKRNGYEALGRDVLGSVKKLSRGRALATHGEELLLADGEHLFAYNASTDSWIDKGVYVPCEPSVRPVIRDTYMQLEPDGAGHPGGLQCFTWIDARGTFFRLLDGSKVARDSTLVHAQAGRCLVRCLGDRFVFVYRGKTDNRLHLRHLSVHAPLANLSDPVAITTASGDYGLAPGGSFDALVMGDSLYVAYQSDAGGLVVRRFTSDNLAIVRGGFALTGQGEQAADVLTLFAGASGVTVAFRAGTDLRLVEFVPDLTGMVRLASIGSGADSFDTLTGVTFEDRIEVYASRSDAAVVKHVVTDEGTTQSDLMLGVRLGGKAFARNDKAYLPVVHDTSPTQPTLFILDSDGNTIAKALPGTAGDAPTVYDCLPQTFFADEAVVLPALVRDRTWVGEGAQAGTIYGQTGVCALSFDFNAPVSSASLAGSLHLSGGYLHQYDGAVIVEAGFHLYPDGVEVQTVPSGTLSEGSYQWVVCYEWTDQTGLDHRSAPSIPVTVQASEGQGAVLTVPPLRLTRKEGVRLVAYRTQANGQVFYRVSSAANDKTVRTVQIEDHHVPDAELLGRESLYTTGGVLENIAPPSLHGLTVHRGRLWGIDSTAPDTIWYSHQNQPGAPVEHNDSMILNIGQNVTALASDGVNLIVFTTDAVYGISGQGPDATGMQSDFSDPQLLHTGSGCIEPRSVVTLPAGIAFLSSRGLSLYAGGQVQPAGVDVEGLLSEGTITSAALLPDANQVRFTLSGGAALVFDFLVGQWSVFTALNAISAVIWQGRYLYLRPDGRVLRETPNRHTDAGEFIKLKLATSHLQLAGMGAVQRIWRALIIGEASRGALLRVRVAHDFAKAASQEALLSPAQGPAYGEVYAFDSTQVYGGSGADFLWRLFLERQQCSAVQFSIEDVQQPGSDPDQPLSLTAIALEVGIKTGVARRGTGSTFQKGGF